MPVRRTPKKLRETRTSDRLVAVLRESRQALDTATLARRVGLHPNGVRLQLQRLVAQGLVERDQARRGIGRPRDIWRLAPRAIAEADRPHTGWAMARFLARAIPPTPQRLREVEQAGAEMGAELARELGPTDVDTPIGQLDRTLEALGFDPTRSEQGRVVSYKLMTCPYAEAVRENPAVVCTLHKGIIGGVLESVAPTAALTGFKANDPGVAGCVVQVTLGEPEDKA